MLLTDPSRLPASIQSLCNHILPFPIHIVTQISTSFLKLTYPDTARTSLQGVIAVRKEGYMQASGSNKLFRWKNKFLKRMEGNEGIIYHTTKKISRGPACSVTSVLQYSNKLPSQIKRDIRKVCQK